MSECESVSRFQNDAHVANTLLRASVGVWFGQDLGGKEAIVPHIV